MRRWGVSHTHHQSLLLNNVLEDFNKRWEEGSWRAFLSLQVPKRPWEWLPLPSPSSDTTVGHDGSTWLLAIKKTQSYNGIHGGLKGSPVQPSFCPQFPYTLSGELSMTPTYVSVSVAMLTVRYPKGMELKGPLLSISLVNKDKCRTMLMLPNLEFCRQRLCYLTWSSAGTCYVFSITLKIQRHIFHPLPTH